MPFTLARPASDVGYAMAKFVALGGTMFNYYMYHGMCKNVHDALQNWSLELVP